MLPTPITMSRQLATRLLKHAQVSPDARVCGLLLGKDGEPTDIAPLHNIAATPKLAHAFETQQFEQVAAAAQQQGLDVLAVYYSHPDSPPEPSIEDIAANPQPMLPVLVISLNIKGVLEMRAFFPNGQDLKESPVQIFL